METTLGNVTVTAELHDTTPTITNAADVQEHYSHLQAEMKEHVYAIFLNGANETLAEKLITVGTADTTTVDTADIARTAVLTNASGVILVHNHPSGDPEPSTHDIDTTEQIRDALNLFDIDLLDHVIIGRDDHHSMRNTNNLTVTT